MSKSAKTPIPNIMDTIFIGIIFIVIGLLVWNTVRIGIIQEATHRNEAHLCWMMSAVFGPPTSGNPPEACQSVRDNAEEMWESYH